jgi:hypothetical protein
MEALKFVVPTMPIDIPSSATGLPVQIPFLIRQNADFDKLMGLVAPIANSKTSKLPAIAANKAVIAANKPARKEKTPKKLKPQKPPSISKKGKAADALKLAKDTRLLALKEKQKTEQRNMRQDETADIHEEVVDEDGSVRTCTISDDLLNAINYTLERIPANHYKGAAIRFAIDLGILMVFEGSAALFGMPKVVGWKLARKAIKTYLNRTHSLAPRLTDPDLPDQTFGDPISGEGNSSASSVSHQGVDVMAAAAQVAPGEVANAAENAIATEAVAACSGEYKKLAELLRDQRLELRMSAFLEDNERDDIRELLRDDLACLDKLPGDHPALLICIKKAAYVPNKHTHTHIS